MNIKRHILSPMGLIAAASILGIIFIIVMSKNIR